MIIMEFASQIMPIILCLLLCILIVVTTVFVYKLIITINKANDLLDDVQKKVHKLDGLFDAIDRGSDAINTVYDKISGVIGGTLFKLFRKKRKGDFDE